MGAVNGNPGLADILGPVDSNQNRQRRDTNLVFMITPRLMALNPERKPHVIYAGRGALEGPGSGPIAPIQREFNRQPQVPTETQPQPPQEQQPPPVPNPPQGQFPPVQPQPQPQPAQPQGPPQ